MNSIENKIQKNFDQLVEYFLGLSNIVQKLKTIN